MSVYYCVWSSNAETITTCKMLHPFDFVLTNHLVIMMHSDVDSDNEEGASPGQLQKQSSTGTNFR